MCGMWTDASCRRVIIQSLRKIRNCPEGTEIINILIIHKLIYITNIKLEEGERKRRGGGPESKTP